MSKLQSASLSDLGRKRKNNEDFVTLFEPTDARERQASGCLYVVADGVGGAARGERASEYAAKKVLYDYYLPSNLPPPERLRQVIQRVNQDIFEYAEVSEHVTRMATTMVAALISENMLIVVNVGDSRAYLIRNGQASQITRDHSIVGEMVANGDLTEAEAQASKIKNRLTRSIGGEAEVHAQVYEPILLQAGDRVLLCSDGLTRYALSPHIAEMASVGTPEEIAQRLIRYANEHGGADNVSVIVVAYEPSGVAEQPTIVARRPQLPDRDTLVTSPKVPVASTKKWRWNWMPIFVLAVVFFIVAIVGAGYFFGDELIVPAPPQSNAIANEFPLPKPSSTYAPVQITPSSLPLISATNSPVTVTETPTFKVEPTFLAISSVASQASMTNCAYTVQQGDYLSKIAFEFGLGNHYKGIYCSNDPSKKCDLSDPSKIQPGWVVIIPDIPVNVCQKNGTIVAPTPSE